VLAGRAKPTEYDNRWVVSQSRNAWEDPAPSVRLRTFRPGRRLASCPGSWARAARVTAM